MTIPAQNHSVILPFVPPGPLQTAVLFIVFNRPEITETVFEAIRTARPPRLYVAADGARGNRQGEVARCERTRQLIDRVDWPCEVHTLFRSHNLGCRKAVSSAIDWFFETEERGIILEDDCLPAPSFFWYCEELLERYATDERIGQISGTAFCTGDLLGDIRADYIYSRHFSIWGWATWRRVWKTYAPALSLWPTFPRDRMLPGTYPDPHERHMRTRNNDSIATGEIDAWSFQWVFANASQSRLAAVPRHNLVVNIGFGEDATHTTFRNPVAPVVAGELTLPTKAPAFVHPDHVYDSALSKRLYPGQILAKIGAVKCRLGDPAFVRAKLRRWIPMSHTA